MIADYISNIYFTMQLVQLEEEHNLLLTKLILSGLHNYQSNLT